MNSITNIFADDNRRQVLHVIEHERNSVAGSPRGRTMQYSGVSRDGLQMLLHRLDHDDLNAGRKYRDLTGSLFVFCEQRMRRPADADDVVRRTIDIVSAKLAGGDDIVNLKAYMIAVARRLLSDYRKRLVPEYLDDNIMHAYKCNRQELQIASIDKEVKEECRLKCIQYLPAEQRQLILNYYNRGLHCKVYREQMAAQLNISIEALNNRISRIRKKLCRCCHCCTKSLRDERLPLIALYA